MGWPVIVRTTSPEATQDAASRLARICASGDVILLVGDLGAGKTAFAQGFASALGVEGPVTSPTFALVRQYRCAVGATVDTLIHADVYRTGSVGEVAELALAELVEERAIALIEWGDMAAPALGPDVLEVTLELSDDGTPQLAQCRTLSIVGRGSWCGREAEVEHALASLPPRTAP